MLNCWFGLVGLVSSNPLMKRILTCLYFCFDKFHCSKASRNFCVCNVAAVLHQVWQQVNMVNLQGCSEWRKRENQGNTFSLQPFFFGERRWCLSWICDETTHCCLFFVSFFWTMVFISSKKIMFISMGILSTRDTPKRCEFHSVLVNLIHQ